MTTFPNRTHLFAAAIALMSSIGCANTQPVGTGSSAGGKADSVGSLPGTIQYLDPGEKATFRLIMRDGDESKCLTDVSEQPYTSRQVTWNRCAVTGQESDFPLQQWTMQNVNTSGTFMLNDLMLYRPSGDQFKVLSFGAKFEGGTKAEIDLIEADSLQLAQGASTLFSSFDFEGQVDDRLVAVLSIFQIQQADNGMRVFCLGKPENNFSVKGAVAVEFSSDADDEFTTVNDRCADIISLAFFK